MMNDIFISRGQYGELDKLKEDGLSCRIWQVTGTGLTNSSQNQHGYEKGADRNWRFVIYSRLVD
jgi:hypothetical protein